MNTRFVFIYAYATNKYLHIEHILKTFYIVHLLAHIYHMQGFILYARVHVKIKSSTERLSPLEGGRTSIYTKYHELRRYSDCLQNFFCMNFLKNSQRRIKFTAKWSKNIYSITGNRLIPFFLSLSSSKGYLKRFFSPANFLKIHIIKTTGLWATSLT